ncbi:MAG: class I SAM-dependent methyltransferase [Halioglobus sp.]|nr:class I SAM-dependent methyltransferase [Halioglobus sp.]
MKKLNPQEWTRFWDESAAITTFGTHTHKNYEFQILEFWQQQLSGNFEQVVDLACGNGALSWIAHDIFAKAKQSTRVTGVDIADINPFKTLGRKSKRYPLLEFVANTSIDQLPFADHSVDIAISQYGFEYSDIEKTVLELDRVLKPTAKICLIMHSTSSKLIRPTTDLIKQSSRALNEVRLHELYLRLDEVCNFPDSDSDPKLLAEEKKLRAAIAAATIDIGDHVDGIEGGAGAITKYVFNMANEFSAKAPRRSTNRRKVILEARTTLEKYLGRIEDMRSAALDKSGEQDLRRCLEAVGFSVDQGVLNYVKLGNIGSTLIARRG